jgi:integration host factor subunit beta
MTKSELIDRLSERRGLPRATAELVVQAFVGQLGDALNDGRRIELRGFGSFKVKAYDGYVGRNPRTGEPIDVAPKVLPLFKASRVLLSRLNPESEGRG